MFITLRDKIELLKKNSLNDDIETPWSIYFLGNKLFIRKQKLSMPSSYFSVYSTETEYGSDCAIWL